MDELYRNKVVELRQRVPVGLKQGLTYLERTKGNIEEAENLFKAHQAKIITIKTGVTVDVASEHLRKNNFDINLALKSIEEELYTLTERILRKHINNREDALVNLSFAVAERNNIIRKYWLDFDDLAKQPSEIFCVLAIVEWLNYESWENLETAVYFNLDIVTDIIDKQLLFPEMAETLKRVRRIHEDQYEEQRFKLKNEGWVSPTPEFSEQEDLFQKQRPILIDKLYEFVQKNMDRFP
jgi:hypothetical protein